MKPRAGGPSRLIKAQAELRKHGLALPDAYEEFPWGHPALKVRAKVFAFVVVDDGVLSVSVKLPSSGLFALTLPFVMPTEYGLGRSGWVTARFRPPDRIPTGLLHAWIAESYHAVAPKRRAGAAGKAAPRGSRKATRGARKRRGEG